MRDHDASPESEADTTVKMAEVTEEQITKYLSRIAYQGPRNLTAETLRELHKCHILSIPFENLSVFEKEEIHLNWAWLFDKMVTRRRGGLCCELNSLFSFLLRFLGFHFEFYAARVYSATEELSPEMAHMVLGVDLGEDKWLVDAGFGDANIAPLRFVQDKEQETESGIYRIRKDGDDKFVYEAKAKVTLSDSTENVPKELHDDWHFREQDSGWKKVYIFDLIPRSIEDFVASYHMANTSPESPFTHQRLCTIARPWGRVTVAHDRFITSAYEGKDAVRKTTKKLGGENEVIKTLQEQFGIRL